MNENISFRMISSLCSSTLKKYKLYHFLNALIWLLISLVPLLTGMLIKNIFDSLSFDNIETYFINIAILAIVSLLNVLLTYSGGILDTKSRFFIGNILKENLFRYFISRNHELKSVEIINIFNTDIGIVEEFISFTIDFLNKIIYFIFAFYIMSTISVEMTLLVVGPLVMLTLIIYSLGNKIRNSYINAKNEDIDNISAFENVVKGHETFCYMSEKDLLIDETVKGFNKRKNKNRHKEVLFEIIEKMIEFSNYLSQIIIMITSLYFFPKDEGVGTFTLFIGYMAYGGIYLLVFQEIYIKYKSIQKFISSLAEKLTLSAKMQINVLEGKDINKSFVLNFPIKFQNYSYAKDQNGFSMELKKNDILFINGPTGGGKTKFLNSIIGGFSDYYGDVYINNEKFKNQYLNKIGYVPQTTLLYNDSLINNITLDAENPDYERLNKCMEYSNLNEEIFKNLLISNDHIGINGKNLSEGQRQRVSIARALYVESKILVLDNAFNNLDYTNKIDIFAKLQNLNIALVVVSEDKDLLKLCQSKKIIFIDGDEIMMKE